MPRFTVILPTHNRADVLPFAVRSVLAQTLTDLELLVVGDGCTDGTAAVALSFDDERVHWLDLPKAPHFGYANRNHALRAAKGEVVAYLGHDDLWLPDHLELLGACFERPEVELAYSRQLFISQQGVVRPGTLNLEDPASLTRFLAGNGWLSPGCVLHRRGCLEKYGYWREDIPQGADTELWTRILEGGKQKNFAYQGVPTLMHFLAAWRAESRKYLLLQRLRALDRSIPPELVVPVPAGMTEQEAFWRELAADPSGWTDRLRRGVRIELDRLATMAYPSFLAIYGHQQLERLIGSSRRSRRPPRRRVP